MWLKVLLWLYYWIAKICMLKQEFASVDNHWLFTGEVITSFNHAMIPTGGNWFQTSSIEHKSDNCAHLLCVIYDQATAFTYGKDIAVQLPI